MLYFVDGVRPLSTTEQHFLTLQNEVIRQYPWPLEFQTLIRLLIKVEQADAQSFFHDFVVGSDTLPRDTQQLWGAFQAATILAEDLVDAPFPEFFRFLYEGDIDQFQNEQLSPQMAFEALRKLEDATAGSDSSAGSILAGFIRYTEFLSGMDNIFPSPPAPRLGDIPTPEELLLFQIFGKQALEPTTFEEISPALAARQNHATEIKRILRWRLPNTDHSRRTLSALWSAFSTLASDQIHRYPSLGLSWNSTLSLDEVLRLSRRFFDFDGQEPVVQRFESTSPESAKEADDDL
jgi:hypothetical protein